MRTSPRFASVALTLVTLFVAAACTDAVRAPTAPETPANSDVAVFTGGTANATATIVLGSGLTSVAERDPANAIISCLGPACPAGALPQPAFIVPTHSSYAAPFGGTRYIAQVSDGTTIASPGYDCCSVAVFDNAFTLPPGVTSASITISVLADNQAFVAINGVAFGIQPPTPFCNFCAPASVFSTPFAPDPSGTNVLSVALLDEGGAVGLDYYATVTYVLPDNTPPVITPTVSGTLGDNGWYTGDVDVSWTVIDNESAVSSSSGCGAVSVTADTDGTTYTCTATSDGGTASESVTIKRDATAPAITFAGNAGSYSVDQQVNITCSAADATSGVASSSCPGAAGGAYTFGVGSHTLNASATDHAGNQSSASTTFTVTVNSGNLCALVESWVSKKGVAHSMCQQLRNGAYRAFINHVKAQSGKSVSAANAAILISLAEQL